MPSPSASRSRKSWPSFESVSGTGSADASTLSQTPLSGVVVDAVVDHPIAVIIRAAALVGVREAVVVRIEIEMVRNPIAVEIVSVVHAILVGVDEVGGVGVHVVRNEVAVFILARVNATAFRRVGNPVVVVVRIARTSSIPSASLSCAHTLDALQTTFVPWQSTVSVHGPEPRLNEHPLLQLAGNSPFEPPSSHVSPGSTAPSPQKNGTQAFAKHFSPLPQCASTVHSKHEAVSTASTAYGRARTAAVIDTASAAVSRQGTQKCIPDPEVASQTGAPDVHPASVLPPA